MRERVAYGVARIAVSRCRCCSCAFDGAGTRVDSAASMRGMFRMPSVAVALVATAAASAPAAPPAPTAPAAPTGCAAPQEPAPALERRAPRLVDRIEAPLAYVALDAGAGDAGAGSALQRLLADPALQEAFGEAPAPEGPEAGQAGADRDALAFARTVLARARGEVEFAWTGTVPGGPPLAVLRARLGEVDAERMRTVLGSGEIAAPLRTVQGHAVYQLRHRSAAERVGHRLEAVVAGLDLIVANHGGAIDEALAVGTSSKRVLAGDPRFVALRERLQAPAGALVVFLDWPRLGSRLATAFDGLPGFLVQFSGLAEPAAVMAAVAPHEDALRSTVLLSFAARSAVDGWLALAQPTPARTLVGELPVGGVGGLVLAIEPRRLVDGEEPVSAFAQLVRGGCGESGLELDRLVRRLGKRGTMQLMLVPSAADAVADGKVAMAAFALQAQSRRAAQDLAEEIQAARQQGRGPRPERSRGDGPRGDGNGGRPDGSRPEGARGRPRHPHDHGHGDRLAAMRCAAIDDLLVFGDDPAVLEAVRAERKAQRSAPHEARVRAALQVLAPRNERVAGLLHFDLGSWTGAERFRGLPLRHTGFLEVPGERDGEAAGEVVVRLQLLSER